MKACKSFLICQSIDTLLVKFKKAQSLDEQAAHITEVNILRNKIKELEVDKIHLVEEHNKTKAQLEKVIKEKEKINAEMVMMRRLQMHLSNQLAGRWGVNENDGRTGTPSPFTSQEDPNSEAASRAQSAKSVKFAEGTKRPKSTKAHSKKLESSSFVRPTASSAGRQAALEKAKEKEKQDAILKKLKEKARKKRSSITKATMSAKTTEDDEESESEYRDDQDEVASDQAQDGEEEQVSDEEEQEVHPRRSSSSRASSSRRSEEDEEESTTKSRNSSRAGRSTDVSDEEAHSYASEEESTRSKKDRKGKGRMD